MSFQTWGGAGEDRERFWLIQQSALPSDLKSIFTSFLKLENYYRLTGSCKDGTERHLHPVVL